MRVNSYLSPQIYGCHFNNTKLQYVFLALKVTGTSVACVRRCLAVLTMIWLSSKQASELSADYSGGL